MSIQDKGLMSRARQEYELIQKEQGDTFIEKAKNRVSHLGDNQHSSNDPVLQASQSAANQQAASANPTGSSQMAQSQSVQPTVASEDNRQL